MTPTDFEDAVRAAVLKASQLQPERVYFADQGVPVPEVDTRIAIRIGGGVPMGVDALDHDYSASRPAGQEIEYRARGQREVTVSLQAFGPVTELELMPAKNVLERVLAALVLPSIRDELNAAGVGIMREGAVQRIPGVRGGTYEDRAILELVVLVSSSAKERTGYIATVEVTPNVTS